MNFELPLKEIEKIEKKYDVYIDFRYGVRQNDRRYFYRRSIFDEWKFGGNTIEELEKTITGGIKNEINRLPKNKKRNARRGKKRNKQNAIRTETSDH